MPCRAALVHADRQIALLGDGVRHFRAEQQASCSGLRALANGQLDGIGPPQVMNVDPVARGQYLVDQGLAVLALRLQHAAVAGGVGRADRGRAARQGHFGIVRESAPAHSGNHHRDIQRDRLRCIPLSEHGGGGALFPVALERDPSQRARKKGQVVESRPSALTQRAVATNAVKPGFRLGLDILDDDRLEDAAGLQRPALGLGIVRHRSEGLLPGFPFLLVKVPQLSARDNLLKAAARRLALADLRGKVLR